MQVRPSGSKGVTTIEEHEAATFGPQQTAAAPAMPPVPVLQDPTTKVDYLRKLVDRRLS